MLLTVNNLKCGYGTKEIVHDVSFSVEKGEFVCVIGANGCGKTTMLTNVLGLVNPFSGTVEINDKNIHAMTLVERAQHFAYLPQEHMPPFPFTSGDVVLMGRTPYIGGAVQNASDEDVRIAWDAMCLLGIQGLAERDYTQLSGGQRQLVLIARCVCQQPDLIVMDEPTASLDFGNQQVVLSQMKNLAGSGVAVLMVTHDPHQAFFCADRVMAMQDGGIIANGSPKAVMTKELLESIYSTRLEVVDVSLPGGDDATVVIAR